MLVKDIRCFQKHLMSKFNPMRFSSKVLCNVVSKNIKIQKDYACSPCGALCSLSFFTTEGTEEHRNRISLVSFENI